MKGPSRQGFLVGFIAFLLASVVAAWVRDVLGVRSVEWGAEGDVQRLVADVLLRLGCYTLLRSLLVGFFELVTPPRLRYGGGDLYGSVVAELEIERRGLSKPRS
jgi:hypothetical protein